LHFALKCLRILTLAKVYLDRSYGQRGGEPRTKLWPQPQQHRPDRSYGPRGGGKPERSYGPTPRPHAGKPQESRFQGAQFCPSRPQYSQVSYSRNTAHLQQCTIAGGLQKGALQFKSVPQSTSPNYCDIGGAQVSFNSFSSK
jgi:hypothetical protein